MVCPECGGQRKVVAFITEFGVVDRIINHLKLTFVAEKPPPSQVSMSTSAQRADLQARRHGGEPYPDGAVRRAACDGGRGHGLYPGVNFRREGSSLDSDDGKTFAEDREP
jgi:hypothetical protein